MLKFNCPILTMTIPGICRTVSAMTAMFVLAAACSPRNDAEIRIEKNFVGEVRLDEIYDEISFVPLRFAESGHLDILGDKMG